jgi:D-inositol-3-phosphate glycosyltransferase
MRILFILENYLPHIGGVEVVFKNLCEGLAAKGHEVTVLTHKLPGTKAEEHISKVRVIRVRCMDSRYLFTFASIPEAVRLARWADVIHTTTYNGAFPAWMAAKIARKPSLITVHETWLGKWRQYSNFSAPVAWMHELLEWCVYHIPRFDNYVCVSNSTERMLKQALPKRASRIITIHNGFDDSMWKKRYLVSQYRKRWGHEKDFIIFAYGRPGTSKGFNHLFDAFPLIKKRIPNAILYLMLSTDKQYAHEVERMKREAPPGIIFLKPQPREDIPKYLQFADCIVVPSISEGFGYAVLEAASSGTPLVATDTTSIPEVIYGKHVLVKPKSAKAIAEGVVKVKQGKYKSTPGKSFPWKESIGKYERLYKRLAG